ncbi:hypothetical protein GGD38_003393 [Chitinophagaceae bacterium OAS944]|nr:hypothetical protein [Chitinophagaceae bacterium OAS944]
MPRPRGDEWLEQKPDIQSLSIAEWALADPQ